MSSWLKLNVVFLLIACGASAAGDLKREEEKNLVFSLVRTFGGFTDERAERDFVMAFDGQKRTSPFLIANDGGHLVAVDYSGEMRKRISGLVGPHREDRRTIPILFKFKSGNRIVDVEFEGGWEARLRPSYGRTFPEATRVAQLECETRELSEVERSLVNEWLEQNVIDYAAKLRRLHYSLQEDLKTYLSTEGAEKRMQTELADAAKSITALANCGNPKLNREATFQSSVIILLTQEGYLFPKK